jgi:hypothetical protein
MPRLIESLTKIFEKERVVFWYDSKAEFAERFESLDLPEVEKIRIENNEFGIKYRITEYFFTNCKLVILRQAQDRDLLKPKSLCC